MAVEGVKGTVDVETTVVVVVGLGSAGRTVMVTMVGPGLLPVPVTRILGFEVAMGPPCCRTRTLVPLTVM